MFPRKTTFLKRAQEKWRCPDEQPVMPKSFVRQQNGALESEGLAATAPHTFLFPWTCWQRALVSQSSSAVMSHISHPLATTECFGGKHLISLVDLDEQASWESQVIFFFPLLSRRPLCRCFNVDSERKSSKQKCRNSSRLGVPVSDIAGVQEGRQPEVELKRSWCHPPISLSALSPWSPGILVYELWGIHTGRHLLW